jgi:hypothetical protein
VGHRAARIFKCGLQRSPCMSRDSHRHCSWREDELIDRMKLDSDHEKQVLPAARFLRRFSENFPLKHCTPTLALSLTSS